MGVGFLGSRFVGRVEELGRLLGALERTEQGKPATILLAGDAGIGKTRLLEELRGQAQRRGYQVLIGGCLEVGDVGLPYVAVVVALRGFAADAEDGLLIAAAKGLPGLERLLPELAGEPTAVSAPGGGLDQLQLFDAIRALFERLSDDAPVLVVLEDLHWADRSTRDLLAFLVRTLHGRIALVASYRSEGLDRRNPLGSFLAELARQPNVERLELAPFGRAELAEHLAAIQGKPLLSTAVDRIFDRSDGNPFYAEELLAAGADQANVGLPSALADVLLARIGALPEPAREVLKVAAVAGRRVGHRLLVAAADREETEVEWGLREAIAGQVLVANAATESYRFRHALLQEAVYGDLLPGERTRLHATYARLLASGDPEAPSRSAAELAWHSLASHDLPGGLAALVRAANDATAVSAPAEAYRHLTQALELWGRVPDAEAVASTDRVELLLRAAEAANHSGEFRPAVGLARDAVEAIDEDADPLRAAGAYERLGHHLLDAELELGRVESLLGACRRAVELVPEQPPTPLRARVAAGLAGALMATGDYEGARRWGEEALAVAGAAGSTGDEAKALMILAVQEVRFGDVRTSRALLRDAAARAAAADNRPLELDAWRDLAVLEFDLGNLASACAALDQAAELAQRTGLAWSSGGIDSRVLGCIAHYHAGTWDEAERVAAAIDDRRPAAGPLSAAALYVEVGRGRAGATERLARLVPYREADPYVAYLAGGCESDLAHWQGDLDGASAVACATLANREQAGAPWMLSAIWPAALGLAAEGGKAEQARAVGDQAAQARSVEVGRDLLARARAALQRARDRGRQVGPEALAWLARCEAEWTRVEGRSDPGRWTAAAEAFAYGYAYEEARSRWRLAEALLGVGDRQQAGVAVRTAYKTAVRLQAEPLRTALEVLARRGRLDLSLPAERGLAGLTPREQEVLQHLMEGRSNRQIARALFITEKTASVHVSNIMSKLGAANRSEAAAIAHRLRLLEPNGLTLDP